MEAPVSTIADNQKAYLWQDGDAWRAPKGTAIPSNLWTADGDTPLVTGTAPGVTWPAYGGVEAGFETTPDRELRKKFIFNKREQPYKYSKGPKSNKVKFRAVDFSPATVMTFLAGGSITETGTGSGIFQWEEGADETFAFIWRLGGEAAALEESVGFYIAECTLGALPGRKADGENLDGFDFELEALTPIINLTSWDPLDV